MMSEDKPHSHFGTGVLVGCLAPLALIGLLIVGGLIYGGYYLFNGYKHDASLQTVMAAVQHNPIAHAVLGDNIAIAGMPSYNFRYNAGRHYASYVFSVRGSKANGTIHAGVSIAAGKTTIRALMLTGPDGRNYELVGPSSNAVWLMRPARYAGGVPFAAT
jgi:Cytochrome oxidase complex assembly protein 1